MSARTPQRRELIELLDPVVAALGYDLDDLSIAAAGRRSLIRVIVDSDEGVDLDAVADISRAVSETLDSRDDAAFAGPYVLEVSSPGVDRPLTEARHWRRAVGRLVKVQLVEPGTTLRGRLIAADDQAITVEAIGTADPVSYPLAQITSGKVEVEFSRAGQPDSSDNDDDEEG